jgi:D-arabinose 1-dehydrogenase-like Zn-dependent alcohol dehydrogenase
MGCNTVAIARGEYKRAFAHELGAHHYIDSTAQDVAAELTKLGGAKIILATVTDSRSMSAAIGGLGIDGRLVVVGASAEPIEVSPLALISGRRSIAGWPSGTATDSEETMAFSVLAGIRPHRNLSARACCRGVRAHDERKARFRVVPPRRLAGVSLSDVVAFGHRPTHHVSAILPSLTVARRMLISHRISRRECGT